MQCGQATLCNPVHPCEAKCTSLGPTHPHCASLPVNRCAALLASSTPQHHVVGLPLRSCQKQWQLQSRRSRWVMDIHCTGLCHWWCRAMASIITKAGWQAG